MCTFFVVVSQLGEGHINIKGQKHFDPFNFFLVPFGYFPEYLIFTPE